jgi:hypothetical protein
MLYTYAARFDVIWNLENFLNRMELNNAYYEKISYNKNPPYLFYLHAAPTDSYYLTRRRLILTPSKWHCQSTQQIYLHIYDFEKDLPLSTNSLHISRVLITWTHMQSHLTLFYPPICELKTV